MENKHPETLTLFPEMVKAFAAVDEAEENARAWTNEAAEQLKAVKTLHRAQKLIDPETPDFKTVLEAIRDHYANTEDTEGGEVNEDTEAPTEDTEGANEPA